MRRPITETELQELFRKIGKGIWYLQYVEDFLSHLITIKLDIKELGGLPMEKAEKALLKYRHNTLGKSLRIVTENKLLTDNLLRRLENFNKERNWLIHRSLYQHGDDLYLDELRYELMKRIEAFSKEALLLQKMILSELEEYSISHSINKDSIEREARKQISYLKDIKFK